MVVCRSNTYGTENNNSAYDGCVELFARSGSNVSVATLFNDGSFYSHGIAFSVNSIGTNYIRFDNGIQIVFDTAKTADSTDKLAYYYTFPKPFINTDYICVSSPDDQNGASYDSVFATSATQVKIKGNNAKWHRLICFGKWK